MLLDTSGLLCLLHKAEPFHAAACEVYQSAQRIFTHAYVLAEFVALAQARRASLEFVADLTRNASIETIWSGQELHQRALTLLLARPDKEYSLCDAVSFVLMRERGVLDALTTDRHFEQEGFRRLLTR